MIDPRMIPPEVVEAAVKAFDESEEDAYVTHAHDIRVAIAAALAAWPGAEVDDGYLLTTRHTVMLPLPTEKSDD